MVATREERWGATRPPLYNLVGELIWPCVISRTKTHPHEVTWRDHTGSTALHRTCRFDHAVDVVREMMGSAESAPAALVQDAHGSTPLHIACWNGSTEIIYLLLETQCDAAKVQDKLGRTPLHVACFSCPTPSVDTLRLLLSANKGCLLKPDKNGCTPLALLIARNESRLREGMQGIDRGLPPTDIYDSVMKTFWRQAFMLLQTSFAAGQIIPKESVLSCPLLHLLVGVPDCPELLLDFAIKLHPEQIRELWNGSLPLHLAAQCPREESFCILKLLSLFPEASSIPDGAGRLSLHLAAACGHLWKPVLEEIFGSHPAAIHRRDVDTSLFPFMLALSTNEAVVHHRNETVGGEKDGRLDSAFELLRADPALLQQSVTA